MLSKEIKTAALKGIALDWAVAKCEGGYNFDATGLPWDVDASNPDDDENGAKWFTPSTDWAQGGPIIEREKISVDRMSYAWAADITDPVDGYIEYTEYGPTALIAAMRCYVASKLGDAVSIPVELLEVF